MIFFFNNTDEFLETHELLHIDYSFSFASSHIQLNIAVSGGRKQGQNDGFELDVIYHEIIDFQASDVLPTFFKLCKVCLDIVSLFCACPK